jgi:hypothetical protein
MPLPKYVKKAAEERRNENFEKGEDEEYDILTSIMDAADNADSSADPDDYRDSARDDATEPDIHYGDLLEWIGYNTSRSSFIEDAVNEMGAPSPFDFFSVIQMGQTRWKGEEFDSEWNTVISDAQELQDQAEAEEADDDDDDDDEDEEEEDSDPEPDFDFPHGLNPADSFGGDTGYDR